MQMLRSTFLTFVLTIFVGLGLASSAMAHPLQSGAERAAVQALEALQAAGLPLGALCGQTHGKSTCPDDTCPTCPAGAATLNFAPLTPVYVPVPVRFALPLPEGEARTTLRLLLGHDAQGPPAGLI